MLENGWDKKGLKFFYKLKKIKKVPHLICFVYLVVSDLPIADTKSGIPHTSILTKIIS